MKTVEQLREEQAKEIAKLEAEHATARLCPLVPDAVQMTRTAKDMPWISYRKRSLSGALDIIAAYTVVPCYKFRKTFLQIVPRGRADDDSEEKEGPFAIVMTVNQGKGYGPNLELYFFGLLDDGSTARINVGIEGPDYIGGFSALGATRTPIAWNYRNHPTEWRIGPGRLAGFADSLVQWSTGSPNDTRFSYLLCADDELRRPGPEMSHAMGQLRNIRDEFQPLKGDSE